MLASAEVFHPEVFPIAVYAVGVAALGLIDDTLGEPPAPDRHEGRPAPRGWRGHGGALLRGEISTGVLKAAGSAGLALLAMSWLSLSDGRWLLAAAVLVLATNVFNLLDLRPGRSSKAFVALGLGLGLGSGEVRPLWAIGLFVAPALVAGFFDLRELAMLGDTGANLLGALAGLWLVLTLSGTGQLVALALLGAITVYGELRSISTLVERTPLLRQLDCLGRPA
jgi:UDP-GlcNAc:undecaprenyl-phosphate/decaprenyl-phosphate GlcNAc-1-phosphate transferase